VYKEETFSCWLTYQEAVSSDIEREKAKKEENDGESKL
jgi:hypothetical protein